MIGLLLLQDFHGSDACIVLGLLIMTNSVIPANLCITVLLLMPAVVAGISDEPRLRVCVRVCDYVILSVCPHNKTKMPETEKG